MTVDGLKENTEHSVRVVSRVRCSDYESAPAAIQLTTLDGVPLANPISEPGSYEWIETSPACRVRVYWAHPPLETVRGQLEATRVELDSSWALSFAEDVPSNRTHQTLDIRTAYCSSSAPIDLRVALRTCPLRSHRSAQVRIMRQHHGRSYMKAWVGSSLPSFLGICNRDWYCDW